MITLVFKEPPGEATLSEAAILGYAGALIELAEQEGGLPITLRLPDNEKWRLKISTAREALGVAKYFVDGVRRVEVARQRAEAAAQEQRRLAGASPIDEEIELVNDAQGVPVAAKKRLRY